MGKEGFAKTNKIPFFAATDNKLGEDIAVWNHKTYVDKPLLVKEEADIIKYRRWYSQFYSEHSKTYAEACENGVDF